MFQPGNSVTFIFINSVYDIDLRKGIFESLLNITGFIKLQPHKKYIMKQYCIL